MLLDMIFINFLIGMPAESGDQYCIPDLGPFTFSFMVSPVPAAFPYSTFLLNFFQFTTKQR